MNICIDGYAALNIPGTFIGSYSSDLIRELTSAEIPEVPHVLFQHQGYEDFLGKKNSWYVPVETNIDRINNDFHDLSNYLKENNINIYHSLNNGFSTPSELSCTYVITIHSLYAVENKTQVNPKYYEKFVKLFPIALERADKIIAVSHFIKKELIRLFNLPEEKIEVLYPLISPIFRPISREQSRSFIQENYGIKHDFILYAGNLHNSKRLHKVLHVFKALNNRHKDIRLIIAGDVGGSRNQYYKYLLGLCEELKISNRVIFTGLIAREHMPYFYNRAKCVISFSEYDGYPLTLAEAASSRTPVIAALTPSVDEVLNNSAVTCDPNKITEIADFIGYICSNNLFRDNLINKMKPPKASTLDDYLKFYNQC